MLSNILKGSLTPLPTYNYVTNVNDTVNRSTYTFNTTDIGTAAANRIVVAVVHFSFTNDTVDINSVTLNNTTMNIAIKALTGSNTAGIYTLPVSSGTTADIVVNGNVTGTRCNVFTYAMYNVNESPIDTDNMWSTNIFTGSISLDTSANSIVIATVNASTSPATGVNWTGVTSDVSINSESTRRVSCGSTQTASASALTVTATRVSNQNSGAFGIVGACFR